MRGEAGLQYVLHNTLSVLRDKALPAFLAGLILAASLLLPPQAHCADPLQEKLRTSRSKEQKNRKTISSLSSTERRLYKDLARIEDSLKTLSSDHASREQEAEKIREQLAASRARLDQTLEAQKRVRAHLGGLLGEAWPVILSARTDTGAHLESWGDSSRRGVWIGALLGQADRDLAELRGKQAETRQELQSLRELEESAAARLKEAEESRQTLLDKRLQFLKKVQSVRSEKLKKEEELRRVMEVIETLQSEIRALNSRKIKDLKGSLPWPAGGRIIAGYNLKSDPPRRGIGLAVPGDPTVRAVSWGSVVHNDQLRGFGRVVILAHGDNYYTLYAFLADTSVRSGQKVEKGEPIGRAGFYPQAKGAGLYFELRFGQKAINPVTWLSAR